MNIAIVFGGNSVEHDVSVVTAKQIYEVAKIKYDVKLIYVDKHDKLFLYNNSEFVFDDFKNNIKNITPIFLKDGAICNHGAFGRIKSYKIDCAIFCCHGGNGENGKIESLFELSGIAVSAGNSLDLELAMNKFATKLLAKSIGISCIKGVLLKDYQTKEEMIKRVEKELDYPVIVKPNCSGSSIGIEIVHGREGLKKALDVAFEFDTSVVVEKAIEDFDEYNCAVLGEPKKFYISDIDMPIKKNQILTFADKYLLGDKKSGMKKQARKFPVLDKKIEEKIKLWSKKTFVEFGFFGVIRIDYIFDKKEQKLYLNEINAVPGSLAIYFFSGRNMGGVEFVDKLVEIGINQNKTIKNHVNFITKLF